MAWRWDVREGARAGSEAFKFRIHWPFSQREKVGRHRLGEHSRVDLELHCNLNNVVETVGERPVAL